MDRQQAGAVQLGHQGGVGRRTEPTVTVTVAVTGTHAGAVTTSPGPAAVPAKTCAATAGASGRK